MDELITVLETVFGSQARQDERGIHTVVRTDGAFVPARIRTSPVAELFVTTRALDGFALSIKWAEPTTEELASDAAFQAAFRYETNDMMLAGLFLDGASRHALLDSIYEYQADDFMTSDVAVFGVLGKLSPHRPGMAKRIWDYELANNEIVAARGGIERHADRIAKALTCACSLAARSTRWAGEYAVLSRELGGGTTRSEVDLGGPPVFTIARNAVDVSLRLGRRFDGAQDHLRTAISAPRVAPDATTVCVYDAELPKWALPRLPRGSKRAIELARYKQRGDQTPLVDDLAKKLIAVASPSAAIVDADSVDVWFDGAPMERERIDAAIELAARWAVGSLAASGPYR
jgi:hypothetical protein